MPRGKSVFVFSVPCQLKVHPPAALPISSASPMTSMCCRGSIGKTPSLFRSKTNDCLTASRASMRFLFRVSVKSGTTVLARSEGLIRSKRPSLNFILRMRVTASSILDSSITPDSTWDTVFCKNSYQSSGTITMSRPALIACGQLELVQPLI